MTSKQKQNVAVTRKQVACIIIADNRGNHCFLSHTKSTLLSFKQNQKLVDTTILLAILLKYSPSCVQQFRMLITFAPIYFRTQFKVIIGCRMLPLKPSNPPIHRTEDCQMFNPLRCHSLSRKPLVSETDCSVQIRILEYYQGGVTPMIWNSIILVFLLPMLLVKT